MVVVVGPGKNELHIGKVLLAPTVRVRFGDCSLGAVPERVALLALCDVLGVARQVRRQRGEVGVAEIGPLFRQAWKLEVMPLLVAVFLAVQPPMKSVRASTDSKLSSMSRTTSMRVPC